MCPVKTKKLGSKHASSAKDNDTPAAPYPVPQWFEKRCVKNMVDPLDELFEDLQLNGKLGSSPASVPLPSKVEDATGLFADAEQVPRQQSISEPVEYESDDGYMIESPSRVEINTAGDSVTPIMSNGQPETGTAQQEDFKASLKDIIMNTLMRPDGVCAFDTPTTVVVQVDRNEDFDFLDAVLTSVAKDNVTRLVSVDPEDLEDLATDFHLAHKTVDLLASSQSAVKKTKSKSKPIAVHHDLDTGNVVLDQLYTEDSFRRTPAGADQLPESLTDIICEHNSPAPPKTNRDGHLDLDLDAIFGIPETAAPLNDSDMPFQAAQRYFNWLTVSTHSKIKGREATRLTLQQILTGDSHATQVIFEELGIVLRPRGPTILHLKNVSALLPNHEDVLRAFKDQVGQLQDKDHKIVIVVSMTRQDDEDEVEPEPHDVSHHDYRGRYPYDYADRYYMHGKPRSRSPYRRPRRRSPYYSPGPAIPEKRARRREYDDESSVSSDTTDYFDSLKRIFNIDDSSTLALLHDSSTYSREAEESKARLDTNIRRLKRYLRHEVGEFKSIDWLDPSADWTIHDSKASLDVLSHEEWDHTPARQAVRQIVGRGLSGNGLQFSDVCLVLERMKRMHDVVERLVDTPANVKSPDTSRLEISKRVDRACQEFGRENWALTQCVKQPHAASAKYEDIVINEQSRDTLKQMLSLYKLKWSSKADRLSALLDVRGALIFGPPGTGKTSTAQILANEHDMPVLHLTAAVVGAVYNMVPYAPGRHEDQWATIFAFARSLAPCIVFLDDAEQEFTSHHHQDNIYLPGRSDTFLRHLTSNAHAQQQPFVILATDGPHKLDKAVVQNLPDKILFNLPTEKQRMTILEKILQKDDLKSGTELMDIVHRTEGFSGNDLKKLCSRATMMWAIENNLPKNQDQVKLSLSADHFGQALRHVQPSVSYRRRLEVEGFAK